MSKQTQRDHFFLGTRMRMLVTAADSGGGNGTSKERTGYFGKLINATGASAILNIGHWVTYTAAVREHAPGQANFTYMAADGWQVTKFVGEHSGY